MRASLPFAGLATIATLLTACELPKRDNGFDPAVAPAGILALVDIGPAELCTPQLVVASNYETATDVSRGRCLALDARDSSDPQNDIAMFRFDLPATATAAAITQSSGTGVFVLDSTYRRSLPTNVPVQFNVTIFDEKGNYSRANTTITLRNARPSAAIAHGYSVPVGGAPWAPGFAIPVDFDGSNSSDEDDDLLRYCWTSAGSAPVCNGSPTFAASLGPTEGRHVVSLSTEDAEVGAELLASRPAVVANWVEAPALWLAQPDVTNTLLRLESGSLPTAPNGSALFFHDVSDLLGIDMIIQIAGSNFFRPLRYPDLVAGPDVAIGSGFRAFASDSTMNVLWAANNPGGSPPYPWTVTGYEATAPGGAPALQSLGASASVGLNTSRSALLESGADGDVWIADSASPPVDPPLFHVSGPQAAAVGQALGVDELPLDLSRRPGTPEMWVLVLSEGRASLRQFSAPGAVPRDVDLGATLATAFQWADGTEAWLATVEYGMLRVDLDVLLAGLDEGLSGETSLAMATTGRADLQVGGGPLTIDPVTGEVWTREGRISPDLYVHPHSGNPPAFVDPDGYVWKSSSGAFRRSRTTATDGVLESFTLPEDGRLPTVDMARGSIWMQTGSEPFISLTETTADGHPGRRINSLQYPGVAGQSLVPDMEAFSISPDGTHAFAAVLDPANDRQIHHFDLTAIPVAATNVLTVTGTYSLFEFGGFHASRASTNPFAWTIVNDDTNSNFYPARVSSAGLQVETTLPLNSNLPNRAMVIARSAANDSACVAVAYEELVVTTTYRHIMRLYHVIPGSAPTLLEQRISANYTRAAGGSNYKLRGLAASRSPVGTDMCWAAYARHAFNANEDLAQDTMVFAASTTATNVRSFTFTGARVRSMVPISPNEVWITAGNNRIRRNAPNGAGVLVGTLDHFDFSGEPAATTGVLTGAETTLIPF